MKKKHIQHERLIRVLESLLSEGYAAYYYIGDNHVTVIDKRAKPTIIPDYKMFVFGEVT